MTEKFDVGDIIVYYRDDDVYSVREVTADASGSPSIRVTRVSTNLELVAWFDPSRFKRHGSVQEKQEREKQIHEMTVEDYRRGVNKLGDMLWKC